MIGAMLEELLEVLPTCKVDLGTFKEDLVDLVDLVVFKEDVGFQICKLIASM